MSTERPRPDELTAVHAAFGAIPTLPRLLTLLGAVGVSPVKSSPAHSAALASVK
ncbi:hypothetical protein [Rhodococcus oxybenzonivorans]|uniref:hypothetical protein n=1 Tax=Rhodococcus oxybenzonivorans TaxID=1990687 RepID=UPI0013A5B40F|nr:hypothetical protein [Rhodococcus oxybenzonivorans]